MLWDSLTHPSLDSVYTYDERLNLLFNIETRVGLVMQSSTFLEHS